MIARFSDWWRLRNPREQRLLLVMAALFLIVFAWLLVIRPLGDRLADARERHGRAVLALAAIRDQADAITRLERGGTAAPGIAVTDLVGTAAREAGFADAVVTAEGSGGARVTIAAARAPAFFGWIADLQRRHGLVVDQVSVRTNSDATLAVELSIRGRGA
jgi:general secretion pathway protein M